MSSNTKKPPQSARTQGANNKSVSKNDTIVNALAEAPPNKIWGRTVR